jgi:hypothetical protein
MIRVFWKKIDPVTRVVFVVMLIIYFLGGINFTIESGMAGAVTAFNGFIFFMALWFCYFIGGVIAYIRGHRQRVAISVLNVLSGWTVIGWIVAIVWACTADVEVRAS